MNLIPVAPHSEDFGLIEYELQLQLNAPKLKVSECYVISNPHVEASYMNYFKTLTPSNVVDVFVPAKNIDQAIADIEENGIAVNPQTGFRFRVGSFEVDKSKPMIEVVRLTIALGNTLNHLQPSTQLNSNTFSSDAPTSGLLRAGYHSLCISENHDYIVFNSAQIKTCNYIKFKGGSNLDQPREEDDLCEQCGRELATIWCKNDNAKFCAKCDAEAHETAIRQRHVRMTLAEARALMECCPHHEDTRVEYFCTVCQTPVCFQCKMIGSHSKGAAASHQLIPIKQAYEEALEAASHKDPIFVKRKQEIDEKMQDADERLAQIIRNEKDVEAEIMRLANAAIERARQLACEKAVTVRSSKLELERKSAEMETLSKFLEIEKKYSGPLNFLAAYDRHSMIVATMQGTEDLPPDLTVEGDLCVFGKLDVCPSAEKPRQSFMRDGFGVRRESNSPPNQPQPQKSSPPPQQIVESPKPAPLSPPKQQVQPAPASPQKQEPKQTPKEQPKQEKAPAKAEKPKPAKKEEKPAKTTRKDDKTNKSKLNDKNTKAAGKTTDKKKGTTQRTTPPPPPKQEEDDGDVDSASMTEESQSQARPSVVARNMPPPPAQKPLPPSPQKAAPPEEPPQKRINPILYKQIPEPPSIVEMARRKEAKNKSRGIELSFQPFEGSEVISNASSATALYLCFPFKNMPQTHLLFSSIRDGRSIERMHQLIDNIGITCVLVKKDDLIFGGFAAAKWNSDGEAFGNQTSSFLFSISLDAYIPYRPHIADACNLYATKDTLTFGRYDLVLADDFDNCSAVIENSYGVGFDPGSTEAQTFLAGEPTFKADAVEVWGFFTIDQ